MNPTWEVADWRLIFRCQNRGKNAILLDWSVLFVNFSTVSENVCMKISPIIQAGLWTIHIGARAIMTTIHIWGSEIGNIMWTKGQGVNNLKNPVYVIIARALVLILFRRVYIRQTRAVIPGSYIWGRGSEAKPLLYFSVLLPTEILN